MGKSSTNGRLSIAIVDYRQDSKNVIELMMLSAALVLCQELGPNPIP